jgi:hypothetical protein
MRVGYLWESQKARNHQEDEDVGGSIILKWILEWGGMDWIKLDQNRNQWKALLNTVMNLPVPQNDGKFLSSCTTDGFSGRAQLHDVS